MVGECQPLSLQQYHSCLVAYSNNSVSAVLTLLMLHKSDLDILSALLEGSIKSLGQALQPFCARVIGWRPVQCG